jgi:malonate-semialdehyde dehydrogenase (acetylating) / methylmalonate-semialdehyde dehydrogenase
VGDIVGRASPFPVGVVGANVPFNFPTMIPLWTLPIAIGAGNTYVLKPSERTPLSAHRVVELLVDAGLPDGEGLGSQSSTG